MGTTEQRRRQLAREKYERQMQRRAEAQKKARRRNVIIGGSLAVVVLAAGGAWAGAGGAFDSEDKSKNSPQAAPTPSAAVTPVKGCSAPAAGQPNGKQWKAEPAMTVDAKAQYTATLDTSCGKVTIELDAAKAPHTVNSFAFLSGEKYFDHVKCHRLTTEGIYVLQCGDPTGTGSGGPGYQFADENLTGATYPAGTVAMANAGAGTNGSQFFLVYKDTQLPPNYTPFGKITGGLDVLQNIAGGGVQGGGGDGAPNAGVVLNSVATVKS
ncbi:peptidylprolyl isomerase [Kitasatospora atroaurantiaca]|uniref:Peptidyl-prolyl cis-trans isomerase n=1 Tax=Kitasatospora atroaurantiaca TaxID=285545 RepID=A0A561EZE0_9ACTN|nr:peptidylprolyl isomerase [Kitasatospora atroaurantiaca]TWE20979.1 peptidyl-prolyl cis-trans isomerase B (cyclophilin B) [Kitasatospora atroaurantiaca]